MRVLVTGGAGFIGSNLCRELLKRNHEVICLDDLSTGRRENIKDLKDDERFLFVDGNVCYPIHVEADWIFNLACPASPAYYSRNPIKVTETCVQGAINVLNLAKETGAKVLQASTSEIYGDPEVHPQPETYYGHCNPVGVRACYNEGKRCAESLFMDYSRQHGVDTRIVRIFNTYGPGMRPDDGRVIPAFVNAAKNGEDLIVVGGGEQTRSFCYIDDLVEGLIRTMCLHDLEEVINLGNPEEITIHDLALKILAMTGSKSKIVKITFPDFDDPARRRPDITRARIRLCWKPTTSLDVGLRKTIERM